MPSVSKHGREVRPPQLAASFSTPDGFVGCRFADNNGPSALKRQVRIGRTTQPYVPIFRAHNHGRTFYRNDEINMPFRQHVDLDPGTLDLMAAAYDDVCKLLEIQSADPRSSALAIAIATAARAGERDPKKLRECGISACSNTQRK
jgi:hypothetical protein